MKIIAELIVLILKAVIPSLLERKHVAVDKQPSVRARALAKMRKHGWIALLLCAIMASGCIGSTTYYVPDGAPVVLRKPVKAAVWVQVDGAKKATVMTIPAGWSCLYLEEIDTE